MSGGVSDKVRDFIAGINKTYDADILEVGGKFEALKLARFSSGVVSLDMALGGGWPFGRLIIVAGEYSTGKTLLALKAMKSVREYDHTSRKHVSLCDSTFQGGMTLFIDVEGSFDTEWASANGLDENEDYVVARPEYSEQAIDIATAAIRENVFDLIVIDSIAALTPSKEIEASAEDWQMGLAARLNNKAMRRWNASLNKMSQQTKMGGPTLLCLNQFRMKIGLVFGDPRTLPGGKGQEFCASIIVYTHGASYDDKKGTKEKPGKELAVGSYGGVVFKNKTFRPKQKYQFNMGLKKTDTLDVCEIDNVGSLMTAGKRLKLIVKKGTSWQFGTIECATLKELEGRIIASPKTQKLLWKSIIKVATGNIV